jgi:hypothetical protein
LGPIWSIDEAGAPADRSARRLAHYRAVAPPSVPSSLSIHHHFPERRERSDHAFPARFQDIISPFSVRYLAVLGAFSTCSPATPRNGAAELAEPSRVVPGGHLAPAPSGRPGSIQPVAMEDQVASFHPTTASDLQ